MMVWLEPMIERVLSWAIVVREVLESLAIARGYVYEDKGGMSLFGQLEYEANSAEEAIESVKNTLLGFDKLNVLGSTSGGTLGADYSMLTDEIGKYKVALDETKNSANKLAEGILETLGYTKEGNRWIKNTEKSFKGLGSILLGVGATIATIFGAKGLFSIGSKIITSISSIFNKLSIEFASFAIGVNDWSKVLKFGIIGAIIALLVSLYSYSEDFRGSVNELIKSLGGILTPILEIVLKVVASLMPIVNYILDALVQILVPIIDAIKPILDLVGNLIISLMPAIDTIIAFFDFILKASFKFLNVFLNPIIGIIEFLAELLSGSFQWSLEVIIGEVKTILAIFESVVKLVVAIGETINALFSGDSSGIKQIWEKFAQDIGRIWGDVAKTFVNAYITILNSVIKGFASFVNGLSSGLNELTSLLSVLWEWAGIPAIPPIPQWNPKLIPQLASGGVVSKPTTVMVGEYANASTNPEIVTPENLMREVFVESMLPIAQAIMNGDQQVVGAIEDLANRPINLNGRKVSENIYEDLQQVAIRKGKMMFAR